MSETQHTMQRRLRERHRLVRGALIGVGAYVLGYILTFLFVEYEVNTDFSNTFSTPWQIDLDVIALFLKYPQIAGSDTDLAGWVFYNTHFVEIVVPEKGYETGSATANILLETSNLTIPAVVWFLIPVLILVGAGYVTALFADRRTTRTGNAIAGGTIVVGYLPLTGIGILLFTAAYGPNTSYEVSMSPESLLAIGLMGIVYPVVLGGIGGLLAWWRTPR